MLVEDCSGGNGQYRLEERECQQREQFRRCPNLIQLGGEEANQESERG